jgi:hypothetical protein
MAKAARNILVRGIRGSLGNFVFRQMRDGSTWISVTPDFSRRKFSKGQKDHQSRFKEAAAYARHASKIHPIYAELTKGTTKNAYNIALSDWFNPPVVHRIERKAGRIRVEASDNVMVTKVLVNILDEEGKVLEKGEALHKNPKTKWWEYATDTDGQIVAEAWDLAGNRSKLVL